MHRNIKFSGTWRQFLLSCQRHRNCASYQVPDGRGVAWIIKQACASDTTLPILVQFDPVVRERTIPYSPDICSRERPATIFVSARPDFDSYSQHVAAPPSHISHG